MHAERPRGAKFCVMRPPSPCHGKVALPHVLTGLTADEVAISHLPRLSVVNGSVDVRDAAPPACFVFAPSATGPLWVK